MENYSFIALHEVYRYQATQLKGFLFCNVVWFSHQGTDPYLLFSIK